MLDLFRKILGQRVLNYYHLVCAILANIVYGFPSRKLRVIGVTGTDGKTTTVNMIASVLRTAGFKTAHLSTVDAQIGEKIYDTGLHTTTPSSFLLQKLMRRAVIAGSKYFVLEVTSHALDQHRTWGIRFETAVLTNVSHEHLDYHKDLQSYMAAKARLFQNVEYRILNMDDQSFEFFSTLTPTLSRTGRGGVLTYGLSKASEVWADNILESLTQTKFTAHFLDEHMLVTLNFPGKFNVYNALAAVAVGRIYNVLPNAMVTGLEKVKGIPGRMEFLTPPSFPARTPQAGGPPPQGEGRIPVLVDFAHTPNAIEKLMEFLRPKIAGQIIHVFGSAGERDASKRPLMGEAADRYADIIILTREDNRRENVEDICEEIAKGIKGKKRGEEYYIIADRREAIKKGLELAGQNDLVVITGKGHEQSLNIDGQETPWDDRKVAREAIGGKQ